eukprot:TRINITY_DN70138_c0_g1_i1.p1 TRINITY_DN70138_c0_g1~~TRINITY_DN70138_c0_g1_i1.p1  ORF type:complete len:393 (-),score=59.25 TRINITY_DN70138_c0_g1_i1:253-1431(-)
MAVVAAPLAQWQFEIRGDWQPFSVAGSAATEELYQAWRTAGGGQAVPSVQSGGGEYVVDFDAMEQRNCQSNRARALRRQEYYSADEVATLRQELERLRQERDALAEQARVSEAQDLVPRRDMWRNLEALADRLFALPAHALSPDTTTPCVVEDLSPSDPREQWLRSQFLSAWEPHRLAYNSAEMCERANIEVLLIVEYYNPQLASDYRYELSRMAAARSSAPDPVPELDNAIRVRTLLGGSSLNEALLYHGCPMEAMEAVSDEGFDPRLAGMNAGAAFGRGCYFTTRASKADYYTEPGIWKGLPGFRFMLVSRVALGAVAEQTAYNKALVRPPANDSGASFHSVLGVPRLRGGCVDHDEFVVYERKQSVLQYIILYRHVDGCVCRTCRNPRR